jgi:5,10-methylenetetrahydromethanopterin reductase
VAAARAHVAAGAQLAGRDPASLHEVLIVPIALGPPEEARLWPRRWFRDGQPWLRYPSRSNLHWLRHAGIDIPDDHDPRQLGPDLADRVCDALGLFGPAEHCAERLLRARAQTGVDHVFLFPAHTWAGAYDLPEAEISAFAGPLGGALR